MQIRPMMMLFSRSTSHRNKQGGRPSDYATSQKMQALFAKPSLKHSAQAVTLKIRSPHVSSTMSHVNDLWLPPTPFLTSLLPCYPSPLTPFLSSSCHPSVLFPSPHKGLSSTQWWRPNLCLHCDLQPDRGREGCGQKDCRTAASRSDQRRLPAKYGALH